MNSIQNQEFGGERPLYGQQDLRLKNVTVHVGESSLKECRHVQAEQCVFEGKYVFWENDGLDLTDCLFAESARSSLWYSRHVRMNHCTVHAPKMFRRVTDADIRQTQFIHGQEMFWDCRGLRLSDVTIAECDYAFMHARDIVIDHYHQDGNYGFQQAKNVEIHHAVINSKDAFWEAENVTIYDSEINGEYLGWYARNMRLVRCHLTGEQLLCYVDGLVLEDCTFGEDANLLFEYSRVQGTIRGHVTSIKNPAEWQVTLDGDCGEWVPGDAPKGGAASWATDPQDWDQPTNRIGSACVKWDDDPQALPLWVADMDYAVAPAIRRALQRRLDHPVYGYVQVPESYYDAVRQWFATEHAWSISRPHMLYTPGVVPAISAIIQAMTRPGDAVLVMTPVYNCFYSSIRNSGCHADEVPLIWDGASYQVDWTTLEAHAAHVRTTMMLICNPHNPVGRVWTKDELRRMAEICLSHDVFVVSDEIHCELTMPGFSYTPYGTLAEPLQRNAAICTSASKAFNIAGLQMSNIVIADDDIRARVDKQININEICDVNPFGHVATEAAYRESHDWLGQTKRYIYDNYCFAADYIRDHMPMWQVRPLQATYLMWVDVSATTRDSEDFCRQLQDTAGVRLAAGAHYGKAGEGYVRINLACSRALLQSALDRIHAFLIAQ